MKQLIQPCFIIADPVPAPPSQRACYTSPDFELWFGNYYNLALGASLDAAQAETYCNAQGSSMVAVARTEKELGFMKMWHGE